MKNSRLTISLFFFIFFVSPLVISTAVPSVARAQSDVGDEPPAAAPMSPQERFTTNRKQVPLDEDGNPIPDSLNEGGEDGKVVLVPDKSHAKPQAKNSSKKGSTGASVATDGAIVYDKPDQDANVIAMLPQGQKIQVSRGMTKGQIRFHKVRAGKKIGYIADIDIVLDEAAAAQVVAKKKSSKQVKKDKNGKPIAEKKPSKPKVREPMFYTKFVGFTFGQSQYKEGIQGVDATTTMPTYGIKISGPDTIIKGPITDFNLTLHYGAPSYYGPLSVGPPSGYLIFADWLLQIPLYNGFNSVGYLEGGPLLIYSSFSLFNGGHTQNLSQINLGWSFLGGYGIRVDDFAFRLEAKYMIEKQSYAAIQLVVQTSL
jgi:hypothetical protein